MTPADPLLRYRERFPILDSTVYMISNSLGAMPREVEDDLREYARTWATRGVRAWDEGWWEMAIGVGDLVGRILGAGPGEVSMHQNVTIAEAIVLSCFDLRGPRRKIVYSEMNFPSVMYFYQNQRELGAEIVRVPTRDGVRVDLDELLAAIDERTLLVPVSHVLFRSAFLQDAAAIVRRAHEVGALVVLDVYQSAGTVPIDVKVLDVDFVVGGSVKWLCGGPGAGYLYVRPDLVPKLTPRLSGWMAHEAPFDFETEHRPRADAWRFLNGTPNVPALYAARAGLRIVGEIGVEAIREKSVRQTALLIRLAGEAGFDVTAPRDPRERGGTVAVRVPNGYEVSKELCRRNVLVDYRPRAGIRISPHFYNTDDEIALAIHELAEVARSLAPAGGSRG